MPEYHDDLFSIETLFCAPDLLVPDAILRLKTNEYKTRNLGRLIRSI